MRKTTKFLTLVSVLTLLVTGCGNKTTEDAHELYEDFHDVIMTDSLNLSKLDSSMGKLIDSYLVDDITIDITNDEDDSRDELIEEYINDEIGDNLLTSYMKVNLVNSFSFQDFLTDGSGTDLDDLEANLTKIKNELEIVKNDEGRLIASTKEMEQMLEIDASYWFSNANDEATEVYVEHLGTFRTQNTSEYLPDNKYVTYYDVIRVKKVTDAGTEEEEITYYTDDIYYYFNIDQNTEKGKIVWFQIQKVTSLEYSEVTEEEYNNYWDDRYEYYSKKADEDTIFDVYKKN